ncbi:hypothetical protein AMECASPLE_027263 [Ameca splendens]|uniref:Uncharacterized protein n=1 Tax=Ameca splendens TaxID=208324 RepID=A0ABV0XI58_9TELE
MVHYIGHRWDRVFMSSRKRMAVCVRFNPTAERADTDLVIDLLPSELTEDALLVQPSWAPLRCSGGQGVSREDESRKSVDAATSGPGVLWPKNIRSYLLLVCYPLRGAHLGYLQLLCFIVLCCASL